MTEILDARGVAIAPGDTAIYGFGVGRSVAMAEAVVLNDMGDYGDMVSLTPSGRVRLRVVRRSYSSGEKPIVDVAPDRIVVLKPIDGPGTTPSLPGSPLPTQDEEARVEIERDIERRKADLRLTECPADEPWWGGDLAAMHAYAAKELAILRRKLKALDEA
jgi:hypothetical protein